MTIDSAIRDRVSRLLCEYLDDGTDVDPAREAVAIRSGTALVLVRLVDVDPPVVRVFSPMLREIGCSTDLLAELNEINAHLSFARMFWRDETVVAATELIAATIDPDELVNACEVVCDIADYYDERLHAKFGGQLAFDDVRD